MHCDDHAQNPCLWYGVWDGSVVADNRLISADWGCRSVVGSRFSRCTCIRAVSRSTMVSARRACRDGSECMWLITRQQPLISNWDCVASLNHAFYEHNYTTRRGHESHISYVRRAIATNFSSKTTKRASNSTPVATVMPTNAPEQQTTHLCSANVHTHTPRIGHKSQITYVRRSG